MLLMQGFEHHKFKSETLRILGIALLTPFCSALYQFVMTDFCFAVNLLAIVKATIICTMAFYGVLNFVIALEILEQCDKQAKNEWSKNEYN
jgi:hypothetical protein